MIKQNIPTVAGLPVYDNNSTTRQSSNFQQYKTHQVDSVVCISRSQCSSLCSQAILGHHFTISERVQPVISHHQAQCKVAYETIKNTDHKNHAELTSTGTSSVSDVYSLSSDALKINCLECKQLCGANNRDYYAVSTAKLINLILINTCHAL